MGEDNNPEEQGTSILSGMPWYIRAIAIVGVPSLIAISLIWSIETRMVSTINESHQRLVELTSLETAHDRRVTENFTGLQRQGDTNEQLLRMICYGVQKTEEAKQGCWK